MSYCRWSSDDFGCDLYCYQDHDGHYVTHVARVRVVGEVPHLDWDLLDKGDTETFAAAHNAQLDYVGHAEKVEIGGIFDGDDFYDGDLEQFRARLIILREAGYRFPDDVLEQVDAEMKAEVAGGGGTE